ncbi:MAG: hypothetical protein IJ228_09875 [Succinivibrio sp.]|nr:hypothetical protein [Succinivibrio sp.]
MAKELNKVAAAVDDTVTLLREAAQSEPEIATRQGELSLALYRLRNRLQVASEVLDNRTTIGVFGASQVGKSYLVSTLAAPGQKLLTTWEGEEISFINHVNPTGGDHEATGVVTRFTHREKSGVPGFPVEVRVFREVELVMLMVNSFYNDFSLNAEVLRELDDNLGGDYIARHLERCASLTLGPDEPNYVSPCDVTQLCDYIRANAKGYFSTLGENDPLWLRLCELAPTLSLKGRSQLFSLFWGGLKMFSFMFERVAGELLKLGGCDKVYAPLESFVTRKPSESDPERLVLTQRKEGTINSIDALGHLFDDSRELEICTDGKEGRASVNFACFAAVTLEVLFPLPGAGNAQSDFFDVLDFPGARERNKNTLADFVKDEVNVVGSTPTSMMAKYGSEFIRRGKVAYLFDRYSRRGEVDILMLCITSAAQSEVTSLVEILDGWITRNVGGSPEQRERYDKNPLVCVLTRFDEPLSKDFKRQEGTVSDSDQIITKTLERFKSLSWLSQWKRGQIHNQFFLARKPGYAPDIFELSSDGSELKIKDDMEPLVHKFGQAMQRDPLMPHLYGGQKAFEAMLRCNDGGAGYILEFMVGNFKNYTESKQRLEESLKRAAAAMLDTLGVYVSRTGDKAVSEARKKARELSLSLMQCDALAHIFSDIRSYMELDDEMLRGRYLQDFQTGLNAERFATLIVKAWDEKLNQLCAGAVFEELFALVFREWKNAQANVRERERGRSEYSFFYDSESNDFITEESKLKGKFKSLMQTYVQALQTAAHSKELDLRKSLVELLEREESRRVSHHILAGIQVRRAQLLLSDFNAYLTFSLARGDEVADVSGQRGERPLFGESVELSYGSYGLPRIPKAMMDDCGRHYLEDYFSCLESLMCGANLKADSRYNISAALNAKLSACLDVMESVV